MRPFFLPPTCLILALAAGCSKHEHAERVPPAPKAPAAPLAPDMAKVAGRWARTDGDYVLQLKTPRSDGAVEAGYFNPSPIHVSKAEVRPGGGTLNVFVELQDVNYPGCTYTLTYRPEQDLLTGVYFQAAQQQQYEVAFQRLP